MILVVEHDPHVAALVCSDLERQGLPATNVADGEAALAVVEHGPAALVILALMLPGMSGIEVCRRIRSDATTAALPIVMLTARATEADRMLGLRAGADDYITKPFSPRELVSRVCAVPPSRKQCARLEGDILKRKSSTGALPFASSSPSWV